MYYFLFILYIFKLIISKENPARSPKEFINYQSESEETIILIL